MRPLPFFENRKNLPWVWKEGANCIRLSVKYSIQNVVLRVPSRKNCKLFPCGLFSCCIFGKMFIEVPQFHETYPTYNFINLIIINIASPMVFNTDVGVSLVLFNISRIFFLSIRSYLALSFLLHIPLITAFENHWRISFIFSSIRWWLLI